MEVDAYNTVLDANILNLVLLGIGLLVVIILFIKIIRYKKQNKKNT